MILFLYNINLNEDAVKIYRETYDIVLSFTIRTSTKKIKFVYFSIFMRPRIFVNKLQPHEGTDTNSTEKV